MPYPTDRVQPGLGSIHRTHPPTHTRDTPLYAVHRPRAVFDERYTPSLATSTPSSSPTTASSSPPPPTSPLSSSFSAPYRHSAGYAYRSREQREAAVKVRAQSPGYPAHRRYAYAQPRAAGFDDEYDDVLPSSSAPSSPTYAFHPKSRYAQYQHQEHQQTLRQPERNEQPRFLAATTHRQAHSHSRTLSSSSSAYTAPSPVLSTPPASASTSTFVLRQNHLSDDRQRQSSQRHTQVTETRHHHQQAPAPVAYSVSRAQLAQTLRVSAQEQVPRTTPRLSIYDLTEDESSPRRPAVVATTAVSSVTATSSFALAPVTATAAAVIPPTASQVDSKPVDDDNDEDDDDEVVPTFASPRRRVSFSTSAERSSSPPRGTAYVPPTSLLAALGPKPVRSAPVRPAEESRGTVQTASENESGGSGLVTPPLSDGEDGAVRQGVEAQGAVEPTVEEKAEETPRRRQRPTLLDLLSVPGPLRSPSPPPAVRADAVDAVVARETEEKTTDAPAVHSRQLPTPELTPTGEGPTQSADMDVEVETAVELPQTPRPRARIVANNAAVWGRDSSLPPSSPPVDSSPFISIDSPVKAAASPFIRIDDTPVKPADEPVKADESPITIDDSPARASTLPPSSPPRTSSRASSPLSDAESDAEDVLPVVPHSLRELEATPPRVMSRPASVVPSRAASVLPSHPASAAPSRPSSVVPARQASAIPSRPASAIPSRAPSALLPTSAVPVSRLATPAAPIAALPSPALPATALLTPVIPTPALARSRSPSRPSTPRYDPTENDLLSSPLSPAPSSSASPSMHGLSIPASPLFAADVLPQVVPPLVRAAEELRQRVEEPRQLAQKDEVKERKRSVPVQDAPRPAKRVRTASPEPVLAKAAVLSKDSKEPRAVKDMTFSAKTAVHAKAAKDTKEPARTGTRVEVHAAKPTKSIPFAKGLHSNVARPAVPRPVPPTKIGAVARPSEASSSESKVVKSEVKAKAEVVKHHVEVKPCAPSLVPAEEEDEKQIDDGKPGSKGRVKRGKRPRTSEFVLSDEEGESESQKGRGRTAAVSASTSAPSSVAVASTSASTSAVPPPPTSAPSATQPISAPEPKTKKRKATTPLPDAADEEEDEAPPRRSKSKKRSPSVAASVFDEEDFVESQASSRRRRRESSRPANGSSSRRRARRASHSEEKGEDLMLVDWDRESPLPLGELEGMVIETLATSRATSMSCEVLWRALVGGRPTLGTMVRNRTPVEGTVKLEDDAPHPDVSTEPMSKREWLHLLTHILASGHARTGLFGRVESSASDSDAANSPQNSPRKRAPQSQPQPQPQQPMSPGRKRLAFKSALRAHWYYVPERDADKERAALIRSMMRGPGKRSETKKYKQYYWKPLAKITRWDREDEL